MSFLRIGDIKLRCLKNWVVECFENEIAGKVMREEVGEGVCLIPCLLRERIHGKIPPPRHRTAPPGRTAMHAMQCNAL